MEKCPQLKTLEVQKKKEDGMVVSFRVPVCEYRMKIHMYEHGGKIDKSCLKELLATCASCDELVKSTEEAMVAQIEEAKLKDAAYTLAEHYATPNNPLPDDLKKAYQDSKELFNMALRAYHLFVKIRIAKHSEQPSDCDFQQELTDVINDIDKLYEALGGDNEKGEDDDES